jgi:hypothetical protein
MNKNDKNLVKAVVGVVFLALILTVGVFLQRSESEKQLEDIDLEKQEVELDSLELGDVLVDSLKN